jgi:hypothetical protein
LKSPSCFIISLFAPIAKRLELTALGMDLEALTAPTYPAQRNTIYTQRRSTLFTMKKQWGQGLLKAKKART